MYIIIDHFHSVEKFATHMKGEASTGV